MKLSIIVPVYNVDTYLRRCVDSILNQTFGDFELILVDDGSPDNCPKICDEYIKKDNRVKVIHKVNGGVSSARNAGVDVAQGDYIGFVDGDDYVDKNMYEILIKNAQKENADISAIRFLQITCEGELLKQEQTYTEDLVYSRNDFIDHFYPDIRWQIMPSVSNKIFKKSLFKEYRFEEGRIYEDSFSQLPLYDQCDTIVLSREYGYYYMINREDSIMTSKFSFKNLILIDLGLANYFFFMKKGIVDQIDYALEEYMNNYLKTLFSVKYLAPDLKKEFKKYKKTFYSLLCAILTNAQICNMKKMVVLMLFFNQSLAFRLTKKYFPECVPKRLI